jgi:hypothetical protein
MRKTYKVSVIRDRAVGVVAHFEPYGLTKFPLRGAVRLAVLIIGVFGSIVGGWLGRVAGQPINPNAPRNWTVLAAAPTKLKFTLPEIVAFSSLYAPPPYSKVTLLNLQFTHSVPSSAWVIPLNPPPLNTLPLSGGTVGMAPSIFTATGFWAKTGCRKVEVWGLSKKYMQMAPSKNDPNAIVSFRITPPSSGKAGDCTVWKYRDGKAPWKPKRIIPPTTHAKNL